jgi:hypothetical protein
MAAAAESEQIILRFYSKADAGTVVDDPGLEIQLRIFHLGQRMSKAT